MTQSNQQAPDPAAFMKSILDRAGLEDFTDVPVVAEFRWGKSGVWKTDEAVPLPEFGFLKIFAIFQTPDEVRVYAVPVEAPKDDKREVAAHRFTLCKTAAPYVIEVIRNEEIFKDEIAAELHRLAESTSRALYGELYGDEGESALAVLEEMRSLVASGKVKEALELLSEDEDDDENDDAEDAPGRV